MRGAGYTPPSRSGRFHGFKQHTTSQERRERRRLMQTVGRRQALKAIKESRKS